MVVGRVRVMGVWEMRVWAVRVVRVVGVRRVAVRIVAVWKVDVTDANGTSSSSHFFGELLLTVVTCWGAKQEWPGRVRRLARCP